MKRGEQLLLRAPPETLAIEYGSLVRRTVASRVLSRRVRSSRPWDRLRRLPYTRGACGCKGQALRARYARP